jgi:ParB-like chromosome segregation protein Spo0J
MSKEERSKVDLWLKTAALPPMSWGSKGKAAAARDTADGSGRSNTNQEIAFLAISDISDGDQILPIDPNAIAAVKASIEMGGQAAPVTVRKLQGKRYELLDGGAVIGALRELGKPDVCAIVLFGLSDWEARFRRVVGYIRRDLKVLDKALVYSWLLDLKKEQVSQVETPSGGHQPAEKFIRKMARELGISKDQASRYSKIAGISADVQAKLRELNLDDKLDTLLKVAKEGDPAKQLVKALELHARPKQTKRTKPEPLEMPAGALTTPPTALNGAGVVGNGPEMPDIPDFLKRAQPGSIYDQIMAEWRRCYLQKLLLAGDRTDRQRFLDEGLMPVLFPEPWATSSALEVLT